MIDKTVSPPCTCGGSLCGKDNRTYVCEVCRREVPWCFGAADDMPDACDDCWYAAHMNSVRDKTKTDEFM